MRKLGLLVLCWLFSLPLQSNIPDTISSLKQEMRTAQNDSLKADALLGIVSVYNQMGYFDSSAFYLAQAQALIKRNRLSFFIPDILAEEASLLKESNQLDSAEAILKQLLALGENERKANVTARAINILGQVHHLKGDYGQALQKFKESRELYVALGDSLKIAGLEQNIAVVLGGMGLVDRAVEYYFSSLRIIEKYGSKQNQALILNNIGRSMDELGEDASAIRYLTQSIEISKELGDRSTLSMAYLNLAILYTKLKKYQASLSHLQLAEDNLPIPPPVSRLARIYYNRGHTYALMNDMENAEVFYTACLDISRESGLLLGVGNALIGLSEISVRNSRHPLALQQISEAIKIADTIGDMNLKVAATRVQYIVYREMGRFQQALEAAESHYTLKDSVLDLQKSEAISRIQTAYETEKREQENLLLLAEKMHNEALLDAQSLTIRKQYWAVGITSLAVILLGIALSLFFIQKKRLKKALGILSVQNEELSRNRAELQELNATKDRFFSIIAHDLKSPFTALLGFTAIMEEEAESMDPERRKHIVKDFRLALQATYDLLENLLAWAENQKGTLKLEPESIQLDQLVQDACHLQVIRARTKGIEIRKEIPAECAVWADIKTTSTILRNLLSNAIKFSSSGTEIHIRCETEDDQAFISIIDQGIGIDPSVMNNLFRLDKRSSRPGTKNEPGTGLGLIMCKEFVEMQGGSITISKNEEQGGTLVTFTLPLSRPTRDD